MQVFGYGKIAGSAGAVEDEDAHFAYVGKYSGLRDVALPAKVRILVGKQAVKISPGTPDLRKLLEFRLRHYCLREHGRAREIAALDDALQALMMQRQEREQRDAEHRHRDHHLEQREAVVLSRPRGRRSIRAASHWISTCAIDKSPSAILTRPVTGLNTSVIT